MAAKRRIGIIYSYNENWIGGSYYIHNLLKALSFLPKSEQPELVILTQTEEEFDKLQVETKYEKLVYFQLFKSVSYSFLQRVMNKVSSLMFNYRIFDKNRDAADIVFPVLTANQEAFGKKQVFWIPDFQEHTFPDFFTNDELKARADWQKHISSQQKMLVLSSQDAMDKYKLIYPNNTTDNRILQFATVQSKEELPHLEVLKEKYGLTKKFFISPNQFLGSQKSYCDT